MSFTFGQTTGSSGAPSIFGTSGQNKDGIVGSGVSGGAQTGGSNSSGIKLASTAGASFALPSTASAPSSTPSLFGSNTTGSPSFFSAKPQSENQVLGSQSGSNRPSTTAGNLFGTPNKTAETARPADGIGSLFGGVTNTQGASSNASIFGSNSGAASSTTTPAASKTINFFGNTSTTPAGAPPASGTSASSALFGGGNHGPEQTGKPNTSTAGGASIFGSAAQSTLSGGGTLFNKPSENKPQNSLFFSAATPSNPNAQSVTSEKGGSDGPQQKQESVSKPLFGNVATTTSAGISQSSNTPLNSTTPKATPSFSLTTSTPQGQSKQASQLPTTTAAAPPGFLAPQTAGSGLSSTPSLTNSAPSFGSTLTSTSTPKPSASSGLSSSVSLSNAGSLNVPSPASSASLPTFGTTGQSTTSNDASSKSIPAATTTVTPAANTAAASDTSKTNIGLGASTSGPKPTPQSRLKNKSMDEIITRWASDLQKYQKEFQKQAFRVADWDKVLVTSSEQIQKLYGSTLEAEKATAEVERQLTTVENDQSEIEYWLEHYEKQVEELLATQGSTGSFGEGLQGPDAERERTFKMAEKLNDKLTEMGKDLGSMVEEINDANKGLNKGSQGDDPIVRVLNGHLSQLQSIDQESAKLQAKVNAVQNVGRTTVINASLLSNNSSDDFFRSYMGRK